MTREEKIRFLRQLQQILINNNSWKGVKQAINESFDMAIKELEEPRWKMCKRELPEPWTLVWTTDNRHRTEICQMSNKGDMDWYDSDEEWIYNHDSIIAWKPYVPTEPYKEDNNG